MSTISLAMIVRNEEASLGHCLGSVGKLVDEIVLVDTGSTDKTIEIAGSYGAKIFAFEWIDDFAAARNFSLAHCSCDWVLVLDADEAIDALDHSTIKNACERPWADAYILAHRHYMLNGFMAIGDNPVTKNTSKYAEGRGHDFYSDHDAIRLARLFDGLRFDNKVHEHLDQSLNRNNKKIEALNAVIHHYGKLIADRESYKESYYLQLAQEQAKSSPNNPWSHFNLMQQALAANKPELAMQAAKSAIALGVTHPMAYCGLGSALQQLERHKEAIEQFDALLRADPDHVMAMANKALSLAVLNEHSQAKGLLSRAIKTKPDYLPPYSHLAKIEASIGNFDGAKVAVEMGLKISPSDPQLLDARVTIGMSAQNWVQAAQDAWAAINLCPTGGEGRWHCFLAELFAQGGEAEKAKAIVDMGLKAFPGNSGLIKMMRGLKGADSLQ